jgi:hypothetical protein
MFANWRTKKANEVSTAGKEKKEAKKEPPQGDKTKTSCPISRSASYHQRSVQMTTT